MPTAARVRPGAGQTTPVPDREVLIGASRYRGAIVANGGRPASDVPTESVAGTDNVAATDSEAATDVARLRIAADRRNAAAAPGEPTRILAVETSVG